MSCLRKWFVLHFIIDVFVAIPLLIAPGYVLSLVGLEWGSVVLARIIAAALMGIGIESYLGRNADKKGYLGMLRLKIIWSGTVILGLVMSLLNKEVDWISVRLLMGVFGFFNIVWVYWYIKLKDL